MSRVRVDSLSKGERFTAAYGGNYTAEGRTHGGTGGAFCVIDREGKHTDFAGCAEVTIGWHERGWLQRQGQGEEAP